MSRPKKTSSARKSILGGTSRPTYVKSKPKTVNMIDWGGVLPTQWPKCPSHGKYLRPSTRFLYEDGIVLVCSAFPAPLRSCPYTMAISVHGMPHELAAAFRLGGPEGFADALGVETV